MVGLDFGDTSDVVFQKSVTLAQSIGAELILLGVLIPAEDRNVYEGRYRAYELKELERLNTELDQLQGQMKRLENLTSFSTITIRHEERKKPGPIGYIGIGLYEAVKWLFVRN